MTSSSRAGTPQDTGRQLGFSPHSRLTGELRTPGSKSAAQRVLLAALLAEGETRIQGLPDGADVTAALALIQTAGARVERLFDAQAAQAAGGAVSVRGCPPFGTGAPGGPEPSGDVHLGESGTLARIATACLALCARPGGRVVLLPRGTLVTRSSLPLFKSLAAAGVVYHRQNLPGTWPVELTSVTPPSTLELWHPASSQEVTALLIAAAAWPDSIELVVRGPIPSLPYVGITRQLLEEFGVAVEETIGTAAGPQALRTFSVPGPLVAPPGPLLLEPDASSAAVALAAACLSGGELHVPGLTPHSPQGDVRIVEHLAAFGCRASAGPDGLRAGGRPTRGAQIDLSSEPDLAPPLAAVAADAALTLRSPSLFTGLETLPGKESDRIAVLARGLGALGLRIETGPDRIAIAPGDSVPYSADRSALVLDPQGDHRMAFAFALLGLFRSGVFVHSPMCVAKSWRTFWEDLATVGAKVQERRDE